MNKSTIFKIGAAIAILIVVGIVVHLESSQSSAPVAGSINPSGGDVIQSVNTLVNGEVVGAKFYQWVALNMPLGTNQVSWCNSTGQVAYTSGARFTLASTTPAGQVSASTTLALSVGTSTKSTITDSKTVWGGLINQALIATSSSAFDGKATVVLGGTGTGATTTIPVAPNECLVAALENPYVTVGDTNGFSATSSVRGYVLNGIFEYSF